MDLADVEALEAINNQLVGAADDPCPDPEALVALLRQQARLEAVTAKLLARFDESAGYVVDGAKSAPAWVATRTRRPKSEIRRALRLGRAMGELPHAEAAFLRGEIAAPHVAAMAAIKNPRTEEHLKRDEAILVEHAKTLSFSHFLRVLRYYEQHADPDGTEEAAEVARLRRAVHLDSSADGMWFGTITLDPISGDIVSSELDRLEQGLFEADWAEAQERLGRDPSPAELRRSSARRRADALIEMATRSKMAPEGGRRPAPLFTVFVGYETLKGRMCELARGMVVAPGSLLPYLDEAMVERAVFAPDNRVECSETQRFFSGATRRAIVLRDRQCQHPYCDAPAERCEADHIAPYPGPTTQENGRLLCGFHNRLRNRDPFNTVDRAPPV